MNVDHLLDDLFTEKRDSVVIEFLTNKDEMDEFEELYDLGFNLDKLIDEKGVGEYDWHEVNMDNSHGYLFMYGSNAEALFNVVKPEIVKAEFISRANAFLRFNKSKEEVLELEVEIR
jgi:hypothetical protein